MSSLSMLDAPDVFFSDDARSSNMSTPEKLDSASEDVKRNAVGVARHCRCQG